MNQQALFENSQGLVVHVLNKHFSQIPHTYHEDLIQEGNFALWKCCLGFDESRNLSFSTYACPAIYRQMHKYIQRHINKHIAVMSLETVVSEDDEGQELKLGGILGEEDDLTTKYLIQDSLKQMLPKEQAVLQALMCGYTQRAVATQFSISQATVHRILYRFREIFIKENNDGNYRT